MPQHTILAKKVTLTADVKAGQIVSWSGEPATTGSKEPAGVAQYDGKTGDTIALTVIGLEDVPGTGLAVGDGVKANAGAIEKAGSAAEAFATVVEITSPKTNALRVVDTVLTKVVLGYNLEQQFTGQHLFPDVNVPLMGGKILKFGKEAYVVTNTVRAPGETVRNVSVAYSSASYALENRLLEGKVAEEFLEESAKVPGVNLQTRAVNTVMKKMRLEGEANKAKLATSASAYATGHTEALSGNDQWDNAASNPLEAISDAKAKIRKSTGQYPNVLHLDVYAYEALKRHPKIIKQLKYSGKDSITTAMLANYFDIENLVVAKAVTVADPNADFTELWGNNTILAYVAPAGARNMEEPSFGYNYVLQGLPRVEKGYFENSDRSWHYPVHFADQAVVTSPGAGFLFTNTAAIK